MCLRELALNPPARVGSSAGKVRRGDAWLGIEELLSLAFAAHSSPVFDDACRRRAQDEDRKWPCILCDKSTRGLPRLLPETAAGDRKQETVGQKEQNWPWTAGCKGSQLQGRSQSRRWGRPLPAPLRQGNRESLRRGCAFDR